MVTTVALIVLLFLLCLAQAGNLFYLNRPDFPRMDFFDFSRRAGKIAEHLAIASACVLLMIGVGPEWRLPPLVIAVLMTVVGSTRDVIRERKKRKGALRNG